MKGGATPVAVGDPPKVSHPPAHNVSSLPASTTGKGVTVITTISHCTQSFVSVTHTINWYEPVSGGKNAGLAVIESTPVNNVPGVQS